MNIDALLQHIHPLIKKALEAFGSEAQVLFSDLIKEAEDAKAKHVLEKSHESFNRQIQQMDKAMMARFQEQLLELAGKTQEEVSAEYKVKFTADDLRLVEEADLEQQVSLETMAAKVLNSVSAELNLVTQRLNAAFKREDILDKTNPFGPSLFTENFGEASSKIQMHISVKLKLFRVFEATTLQKLNNILQNVNANLKSQGFLPNAEVIHKSSRNAGGRGGSGGGHGGEHSAATDAGSGGGMGEMVGASGGLDSAAIPVMHSAHGAQQGQMIQSIMQPMQSMPMSGGMFDIADPIVKQIYDMIAKDGYGVLQRLLGESRGGVETRISSSGIGDQNFVSKQEVKDDELLDILNTLQRQAIDQENVPLLEGEFQPATVAQSIGSALQTRSEALGAETTLSKTGSDVVNLVDMLFDFILSDDYLSDTVKNIISELKIPLTKVALLDQSFFSDNQHPARQLLNELARSGMAVSREKNLTNDQNFKNISGTVKKVKQNFDKETSVFTEALAEFSNNTQKHTRKTHVLEQRLMDAEKGRAKTEHAEEMVRHLYKKLRSRVPPSEDVDIFLDTGWRDVLMMTCLKFGSHSKQWKSDEELTTKLMKSILLAKKARLDGKQMRIPMDLLKLLKQALDRISYDANESKKILSHLAKHYQKIAASTAEEVREELIQLGGETEVAKRVVVSEVKEAMERGEESDLGGVIVINVEGEDVLAQSVDKDKDLNDDELAALAENAKIQEAREQELRAKIRIEKKKIAELPMEALDEKIKNLDQEIPKAEIVPDIKVNEEFVAGNSWYDMVVGLPIGAWLELHQKEGEVKLRCKLVANIKTLEKLIFVNKAGAKVAERKVTVLARELKEQKSRVINDNMIFDQALENVIVSLRAK